MYNSQPTISVVVPTLNQKPYLSDCLQSIKNQTLPIEVIIIDGGSEDGTVEFLHRNTNLYDYFISESDAGQSEAINKGFKVSRGQYVAWLNSDDNYCEQSLESVWRKIVEQEFPEVCIFSGLKRNKYTKESKLVNPCSNTRNRLKKIMCVLQPSVFFRRDVLSRFGCLREDLHYVMDWEYLNRLLRDDAVRLYTNDLIVSQLFVYPETKTETGGWRRAREISNVGRELNGILDINYLVFQLKNILSVVPATKVRKYLAFFAEKIIFSPLQKRRLTMVQGWPE